MNTVKNCYSPAGMSYVAPPSYRYLADCPKCRYGTLIWWFYRDEERGRTITSSKVRVCIDCHQRFKKRGGVWVTV